MRGVSCGKERRVSKVGVGFAAVVENAPSAPTWALKVVVRMRVTTVPAPNYLTVFAQHVSLLAGTVFSRWLIYFVCRLSGADSRNCVRTLLPFIHRTKSFCRCARAPNCGRKKPVESPSPIHRNIQAARLEAQAGNLVAGSRRLIPSQGSAHLCTPRFQCETQIVPPETVSPRFHGDIHSN